jgi:hypothetical protein
MEKYLRSDMLYHDYSWTAYGNDNPKISGKPDSTFLSRREGYEVLYFINKCAELHSITNKADCQKIERMLRNNVPPNIHSQENVEQWINDNWNKYY